MEGIYDIKLGDRPVGRAEVTREGLYYRFRCQCHLDVDSVCKIFAGEVSLGVLVPKEDRFMLETRMPIKRFKEGNVAFQVVPNRPVLTGKFIPIKPEEPFAYIERLKDAYITRQDGQVGVIIREKAGT